MSRQAASAKPSAVSRALARDRLGVPAVLAFILAGVAPLTVAAGLIPTAYAVTGLTGIPAAFLVIAVILAVFATGYMAMSRQHRERGGVLRVHRPGARPRRRRGRGADRAAGLQLLADRPVRDARPGRCQPGRRPPGRARAVVGVGAGRVGDRRRAGPAAGRYHRAGAGRADRDRDRRDPRRDRHRARPPGGRPSQLRHAVPVGADRRRGSARSGCWR